MVEIHSLANSDWDEVEPGLSATQLCHGDRLHAQVVEIEPGNRDEVDPHSHPHEQITFVVSGGVIMTIDGEDHELASDDAVVIPGDVPHDARNESDSTAKLIDIFSPPREDLI